MRAADVQRVARKYLDPEKVQLVAVGDAAKIKAGMEKYGAVEVYDSNGAPLPPGNVEAARPIGHLRGRVKGMARANPLALVSHRQLQNTPKA